MTWQATMQVDVDLWMTVIDGWPEFLPIRATGNWIQSSRPYRHCGLNDSLGFAMKLCFLNLNSLTPINMLQ